MTACKPKIRFSGPLTFGILCFWLLVPATLGAAETATWRPTYDLVMGLISGLMLFP